MAGRLDCLSFGLLLMLSPLPETLDLLLLSQGSSCHAPSLPSRKSPVLTILKAPKPSALLQCPVHMPVSLPRPPLDARIPERPLVLAPWLEHGGVPANNFTCVTSDPYILGYKRWSLGTVTSAERHGSINRKPDPHRITSGPLP